MKPIAIVAIFLVFFPGAFERLDAYTINFENLSEGTDVSNQYSSLGVTFSGGTILQAGSWLNELEYPPYSWSNVLGVGSGPLILFFEIPETDFTVYVTYAAALTLTFYDSGNNVIGLEDSLYSSNVGTFGDAGSSPNELFSFHSASGISRLVFDSDFSYTLDDVTVSTVPEPATWILLAISVLGFGFHGTKRFFCRLSSSGMKGEKL
jgi:hypothetical protein